MFGQVVLAAAVGIGCSFGITSCVVSHTVGYLYVTGAQYNQVGVYKITNNTGNLTRVVPPIGSGGINPVDAVVAQAGKFLYVLNAGCADPALFPHAKFQCASGVQPTASNISLFTIGGDGVLTFEESYSSQGLNSVAISVDSSGSYLYVLDQNTPTANTPSQYANDGDVTVLMMDPNTGLLSVQQNAQLTGTDGSQLYFFPVGEDPVWFKAFNNYLFTIDRDTGATPNASFVNVYSTASPGQLLQTQNAEFPTGATNLVYINSGGSNLYLLDAGDPTNPASKLYNGAIYIYTVSTNGALASVVGGAEDQGSAALGYTNSVNPTVVISDSTNKFVYVANYGLNTGFTSPASNISSYFINTSTGNLQPVAGSGSAGTVTTGTGAGPRCILEDPSNQYIFTANYLDSTITGKSLNVESGALTAQRGTATTTAPGNPTWCVASGNVF
jgi:6-phosphogluconolactonase (cycloisomerase 2 family)